MVILWWWWQWYWKWWGGLTCSRAWECLAPVLAREWQTKSCPEIKFNAKFCICLWVIIKFIRVKTVSFRKPYHHHLGVVWRNIRTLTSAISSSSRLLAIHWPENHRIFESLLKVECLICQYPWVLAIYEYWHPRTFYHYFYHNFCHFFCHYFNHYCYHYFHHWHYITTIFTTIFTTIVIRTIFTTILTINITTILPLLGSGHLRVLASAHFLPLSLPQFLPLFLPLF